MSPFLFFQKKNNSKPDKKSEEAIWYREVARPGTDYNLCVDDIILVVLDICCETEPVKSKVKKSKRKIVEDKEEGGEAGCDQPARKKKKNDIDPSYINVSIGNIVCGKDDGTKDFYEVSGVASEVVSSFDVQVTDWESYTLDEFRINVLAHILKKLPDMSKRIGIFSMIFQRPAKNQKRVFQDNIIKDTMKLKELTLYNTKDREIDKVRSGNTEVTKVNLFISFGCSKNNQGITTHYIRHMIRTLGLNYRLKTNVVLVNQNNYEENNENYVEEEDDSDDDNDDSNSTSSEPEYGKFSQSSAQSPQEIARKSKSIKTSGFEIPLKMENI